MKRHLLITSLALVAIAGTIVAGPLTPPAGPVAPTYKTLAEVEPRTAINAANTPGDAFALYKISKPGSYYLTGNVTGSSGRIGILIAASDVTVDLNGFELYGGDGTTDGITIPGPGDGGLFNNITVKNGSVVGWGGEGVYLSNGTGFNGRIEGVVASNNKGSGLAVGASGIITDCCSTYNKGTGLASQSTSLIMNCTATENGSRGIYVEDGCTVRGCTIESSGFEGIRAADGCEVLDCVVRLCSWDGIRVANGCRVFGNTTQDNGYMSGSGAGIYATGSDNRIEGNNCVGADVGIDVDGPGNIIVRNTCSGNTTNWYIVANNVYGPIIDRTAPASPPVSGNAAPDASGSTHPNANLSY